MGNPFRKRPRSLFLMALVFSLMLIFGCEMEKEMFEPELVQYLSDPENGLVKTRQYDQVVWQLKLMPGAFQQVNQDLEAGEAHGNSLHMMLTVSSGTAYKASDVMMTEIGSYEGYADRMIRLNFRISEMVQLHIGDRVFLPVLSNMENTFGLSEDRKIHIVFASTTFPKQLSDFPEMDLVLNDQVFDSGISHFVFLKDHLKRIPKLKH